MPGYLLQKTQLRKRLNQSKVPGCRIPPDISHADLAFSYIGLLSQGKSDFDHIEPFREEDFFAMALEVEHVPSSATLRQRFDKAASQAGWETILLEESASLLRNLNVTLTPVILGDSGKERRYLPLDVDVAPFDNSCTKKEGVSRTYKGFDGYAPIFAYLGKEGYVVHTELRTGSTHSQKGTPEFLKQAILYAKQASNLPLLLRMDSGNDSADTLNVCLAEETAVDFIIKRNLRKESLDVWLETARSIGKKEELRPGKVRYTGETTLVRNKVGKPIRVVFEVIETTHESNGQLLLVPDIEVHTFWTSLPDEPEVVLGLYREHGTMEQFHSEIKTDLDLERLPSGKFATNNLVLHFGIFAYNLLRIVGQESLKKEDTPLKNKVIRRRIRTVIQSIITLAAKLTTHARQYRLRLSKGSPWLLFYQRMNASLAR